MTVENFFYSEKPLVMGILNVTPDSFSDGGAYTDIDRAVTHAEAMIAAAVDIIDVGGQSTRPGYQEISPKEELQRVVPVIKAIRKRSSLPISVDTYFPEVARAALEAGATIINDVKGMDNAEMFTVANEFTECGLIIMHSRPRNKNLSVKMDIQHFYQEKIAECEKHGIDLQRICFDPGIGFGKSLEENIEILKEPEAFKYKDFPVLYGVSRKRTIQAIINEDNPQDRDFGSVAASLFAIEQGANIVRVHNVKGMTDTLTMWQKLKS